MLDIDFSSNKVHFSINNKYSDFSLSTPSSSPCETAGVRVGSVVRVSASSSLLPLSLCGTVVCVVIIHVSVCVVKFVVCVCERVYVCVH